MKTSRGFSLVPIPLTLAAAAAGLAIGVGAFAFHYAKGGSYLGNDPSTCANCHVMAGHYAGWQAAPHHRVATCNDCHTPAGPISKYVVKATNGWHHSMAFTLGGYPDVIRARPSSREVVEGNCRRCHADLVERMTSGGRFPGDGVSCIRCHDSVGHLR
jgi:cytochrome c nitrite reductase small subunit